MNHIRLTWAGGQKVNKVSDVINTHSARQDNKAAASVLRVWSAIFVVILTIIERELIN